MNKKIIAAAIAAVVAAPAAMAADTVVYGKVRQAVDIVDMGTVDNVQINDRTSRVGFKGSEDLGNGLKAIWGLEFGVAVSGNNGNGFESGAKNEFSTSSPIFGGRNAFVGLAGDFGTFVIGRHDTPLKISTGSLDLFGDTIADNNQSFTEGLADRRADGTVAYISPSFSGLTAAVALVPGENNNADGIADAYSVALMYSNGGIYASLATEQGDKDIDALPGVDLDQTRFGIGYTMDAFTVNFVWENVDLDTVSDTDKWVVSGAYTMGNNKIKLKYFDTEEDIANVDGDGWALGLEHNFSKRTQAQVIYISSDHDTASLDGDVFSLQLNHNF